MFFVANFVAHSKFVIVPKSWIRGIDDHWEKFINNSINRNQTFLCYYSARAINEEGRPNPDFLPVFRIPVNANFPDDGCYYANLICYKRSFEDALKVLLRRRANSIPALYNVHRLNELPIPDIQNDVNEDIPIVNPLLDTQRNENANSSSFSGENEMIDDGNAQSEDNEVGVIAVRIEDESNNGTQIQENHNDLRASDDNDSDQIENQSLNVEQGVIHTQREDDYIEIGQTANGSEEFVASQDETNLQQPENDLQNDGFADQGADGGNQVNGFNIEGNDDPLRLQYSANKRAAVSITDHIETVETTQCENEDESAGGLRANWLSETDSTGSNSNSETAIQEIFIPAHNDNDMNNSDCEETEIDPPARDPNDNEMCDPVKIEPVPIYEPIQANDNELNELLDEEDMATEEYDDDITIVIDSKVGFAMPMNANSEGLIKQQNDIVSGNIAFNQTKKGREYKYGPDKLIVPSKVVDKLKRWNTHPEKATEDYDKRATIALLLVCVEPDDLVKNNVSQKAKDLINDFLNVRTGGDSARLAKVDQFIADFCKKKAHEAPQKHPMTAA